MSSSGTDTPMEVRVRELQKILQVERSELLRGLEHLEEDYKLLLSDVPDEELHWLLLRSAFITLSVHWEMFVNKLLKRVQRMMLERVCDCFFILLCRCFCASFRTDYVAAGEEVLLLLARGQDRRVRGVLEGAERHGKHSNGG